MFRFEGCPAHCKNSPALNHTGCTREAPSRSTTSVWKLKMTKKEEKVRSEQEPALTKIFRQQDDQDQQRLREGPSGDGTLVPGDEDEAAARARCQCPRILRAAGAPVISDFNSRQEERTTRGTTTSGDPRRYNNQSQIDAKIMTTAKWTEMNVSEN